VTRKALRTSCIVVSLLAMLPVPLLTLPLFICIGYMFSKSGIADDLYQMPYVRMGLIRGGLAAGTVVLVLYGMIA
jgi:TRAP-type C4-dicarboxylate transport system permease large subunit